MQAIFDESLVFSFQKVVEQSVMEIFKGKGMIGFQDLLRRGMNEIACTLQKRVMERINDELRDNISLLEGWVVELHDTKTITSPFGPVIYCKSGNVVSSTSKQTRIMWPTRKKGFGHLIRG